MNSFLKITPFLISAYMIGCSQTESAGITTETENAIAVRVVDHGKPVAKVQYKIMPSWFIADTTQTAPQDLYTYSGEANDSGWIRIDGHPEGSFTLEISKENKSIVQQFTLNKLNPEFQDDSVALLSRGALEGWVDLPENADYAWVFVKGIDRAEKTDAQGHFTLTDLPSGKLEILAWTAVNASVAGVANVKIEPDSVLSIETLTPPDGDETTYDPWQYSQKIKPTSFISAWQKPLTFPAVITLRLNSTNFDFSTARDDGRDLRIFNTNENPVDFEIDSWSPKYQSAVINLRLESPEDTVGFWKLKWGYPTALKQEDAPVWDGISDSTLLATNSILILDFENGNKNNLPGSLNNKWYISPEDENIIDTAFYRNNLLGVEEAGGDRSGKALHITYTANWPDFALMGTRIASNPQDLGHMDSLEVYIRGNGKYNIILENLDEEKNYKVQYKGDAKENWERIVIRPQDFQDDTISYHGWDKTRNRITHFTIFAFDGTDLWIDDARFYGINRDDLK